MGPETNHYVCSKEQMKSGKHLWAPTIVYVGSMTWEKASIKPGCISTVTPRLAMAELPPA